MRFIVILNPAAGSLGKSPFGDKPDQLREAFARAGAEAEVRIPAPDQLAAALRAATSERPDAVIVGGGDGTVRGAAAALADSGVALGVLPLGTLNHFAKDLQVPLKVEDAIPALAAGQAREVDLGEVNGHVFINNCSLGAYAEAVRRRDRLREGRGLGKGWAMLCAAFTEFRRLRRLRLRITLQAERAENRGGEVRSVRTPLLVVGNNRYSGQMLRQNLRPRLDEGRLWLYTAQTHGRLAALHLMLQSLVRRLDETAHLAAEPAVAFTIASEGGPVPIAADGELLALQPPFHFRVRARALRVLAPAPRNREAVP